MEGGEGVGKSAFLEDLVGALRLESPLMTREPGGTDSAQLIREIFANPVAGDPWTMRTEALLVAAARAQHVDRKIRPALAAGRWVFSDRYHDSTRVYQGIVGDLPRELVEALVAIATDGCEPDLTFVLDCDIALALDRVKGRSDSAGDDGVARYDEAALQVHEEIRAGYRQLAAENPERIVVLDSSGPVAGVVQRAVGLMRERGICARDLGE